MFDLHPVISGLTMFYAAASIGSLLAHLTVRLGALTQRAAGPWPCGWPAFLPLASVLVVPLAAVFHPSDVGFFEYGHVAWHRVQQGWHASPTIHTALHAGNLALLLLFLAQLVRMIYRLTRQHVAIRELLKNAIRIDAPGTGLGTAVYCIPSPWFGCFTFGIVCPRILITSALLEQLTARELETVLAHEEAHIRRRDRLVETIQHVVSSLAPLPGSSRLLARWRHEAERECDAYAARRVGNSHDVAATLVRVAQLAKRSPLPLQGISAFIDPNDDIEGRVRVLLEAADRRGSEPPTYVPVLAASSLLAMLFAGFWVRHLVELFVHH